MILLAVIDRNRAIGKNNGLLYPLPEDMRRFRQLTIGNTVVCGRKTLESFPNGKPLPKRETIVLSRQYENPGFASLSVARSVPDVLRMVEQIEDERTVYIIGGESVYRLFAPLCDQALLTEVDAQDDDADAFFPALTQADGWYETETGPWQVSESGLTFRYVTYQKK